MNESCMFQISRFPMINEALMGWNNSGAEEKVGVYMDESERLLLRFLLDPSVFSYPDNMQKLSDSNENSVKSSLVLFLS